MRRLFWLLNFHEDVSTSISANQAHLATAVRFRRDATVGLLENEACSLASSSALEKPDARRCR